MQARDEARQLREVFNHGRRTNLHRVDRRPTCAYISGCTNYSTYIGMLVVHETERDLPR